MPPPILTEEEIDVARQSQEHAYRFVQTYWESTGYDPNLAPLNDQGLTTCLSVPVSPTSIVDSTSVMEARIPIVMTAPEGLSTTHRRNLFSYASRPLFRVGSLVSIVATGQDVVLGSGELSREQDKLREQCEVLERKNSNTEKELSAVPFNFTVYSCSEKDNYTNNLIRRGYKHSKNAKKILSRTVSVPERRLIGEPPRPPLLSSCSSCVLEFFCSI
ncbi:unnamed protein product [Vicia faba]|uniref:Uncharacterized protein n=1 Tax=Vicia faba TaxID=3906 RepID=A0AAV1AX04_VICFA|nr:unnamed protein product [Vicia faba]